MALHLPWYRIPRLTAVSAYSLSWSISKSLSGRLFAFHLRLLAFHLPFEHGGAGRGACASAQEAACRGLAPIGSPNTSYDRWVASLTAATQRS